MPSHWPANGSTPCGVVMPVTEPILIVVSVTPWVVDPLTCSTGLGVLQRGRVQLGQPVQVVGAVLGVSHLGILAARPRGPSRRYPPPRSWRRRPPRVVAALAPVVATPVVAVPALSSSSPHAVVTTLISATAARAFRPIRLMCPHFLGRTDPRCSPGRRRPPPRRAGSLRRTLQYRSLLHESSGRCLHDERGVLSCGDASPPTRRPTTETAPDHAPGAAFGVFAPPGASRSDGPAGADVADRGGDQGAVDPDGRAAVRRARHRGRVVAPDQRGGRQRQQLGGPVPLRLEGGARAGHLRVPDPALDAPASAARRRGDVERRGATTSVRASSATCCLSWRRPRPTTGTT